jgi:hypothetical protein
MNEIHDYYMNVHMILVIAAWGVLVYSARKAPPAKLGVIGFAGGFITYSGLSMWLQDSMGLEVYIALMRQEWIELSPLAGLFIATIATGLTACAISATRTRHMRQRALFDKAVADIEKVKSDVKAQIRRAREESVNKP